jgi:hypothetical protein
MDERIVEALTITQREHSLKRNMKFDTVAYLLHERNVDPQKQPLLSNIHTQKYNNGVMQSISGQRLGKQISAYRIVLCNAVTSTIRILFSVESVQSACRRSEFRS